MGTEDFAVNGSEIEPSEDSPYGAEDTAGGEPAPASEGGGEATPAATDDALGAISAIGDGAGPELLAEWGSDGAENVQMIQAEASEILQGVSSQERDALFDAIDNLPGQQQAGVYRMLLERAQAKAGKPAPETRKGPSPMEESAHDQLSAEIDQVREERNKANNMGRHDRATRLDKQLRGLYEKRDGVGVPQRPGVQRQSAASFSVTS